MKTLRHKVILYDDVCPLCKAYTSGFVSLGWLLPEHRIGFSEAPPALLGRIDLDRARHEIPLYDTESGETLYGKDALFYILGEALPLLKSLFRSVVFRAVVFGLYQLITYNRRIIAGSQKPEQGFDCAPDFNVFYRLLYIGLMFGAVLLLGFDTTPMPDATSQQMLGALTGAGLLRGLFFQNNRQRIGYYGHFATVLFLVALFARVLGWNAWTLLLLPVLAAYWLAKRTALLND
jgi:predicted DCC family thiol-disulfide oxidoreductase YuxK